MPSCPLPRFQSPRRTGERVDERRIEQGGQVAVTVDVIDGLTVRRRGQRPQAVQVRVHADRQRHHVRVLLAHGCGVCARRLHSNVCVGVCDQKCHVGCVGPVAFGCREYIARLKINIHRGEQKRASKLVSIPSRNIDQFWSFFYWRCLRTVCDRILTKVSRHALSASPHYLVKYECCKLAFCVRSAVVFLRYDRRQQCCNRIELVFIDFYFNRVLNR